MSILQLRHGKITQGSRTGEPWFIVNFLCFELRWRYPHSSVWLHWYLKASLLGFEWFPWKKTEKNSCYAVDTSNGILTTTPFFAGVPSLPMDPKEMMAEYDRTAPNDQSVALYKKVKARLNE